VQCVQIGTEMYVEHEIRIFSIYSTSTLPFYTITNSVPHTTLRVVDNWFYWKYSFDFEKAGKQVGQQNDLMVSAQCLKLMSFFRFLPTQDRGIKK